MPRIAAGESDSKPLQGAGEAKVPEEAADPVPGAQGIDAVLLLGELSLAMIRAAEAAKCGRARSSRTTLRAIAPGREAACRANSV